MERKVLVHRVDMEIKLKGMKPCTKSWSKCYNMYQQLKQENEDMERRLKEDREDMDHIIHLEHIHMECKNIKIDPVGKAKKMVITGMWEDHIHSCETADLPSSKYKKILLMFPPFWYTPAYLFFNNASYFSTTCITFGGCLYLFHHHESHIIIIPFIHKFNTF